MENHYRIVAVNVSRQKKLDANPKANQRIEFVRKLEDLLVQLLPANLCFF